MSIGTGSSPVQTARATPSGVAFCVYIYGMSFVYILYSATVDRFYVGYTKDVAGRLAAHNAGESNWTRNKGPWELVLVEAYGEDTAARKRERAIKKKKSAAYIRWLIESANTE